MATLTAGSSITLTLDQDDVLTTVGNATANITLASGQSKGTQTLTGTQYLGPYGQYATVILTAVTDTTYTSTSRTSAATPAVYATDSSGNVTGLVGPSGTAGFVDAGLFGASPSATAAVNTAAIQAALNQGGLVSISLPGVYKINADLLIGSNTTVNIGRGVIIVRTDGGQSSIVFKNSTPVSGNSNIAITGQGTIYCNSNGYVNIYGANNVDCPYIAELYNANIPGLAENGTIQATPDHASGLFFDNVDGLYVSGIRVMMANKYQIYGSAIKNFIFENIEIYSDDYLNPANGSTLGRDAIHVQGNTYNGVVRNIRGTVNDDFIVLNVRDTSGMVTSRSVGPIRNIRIENIKNKNQRRSGCSVHVYGGLDVGTVDVAKTNGYDVAPTISSITQTGGIATLTTNTAHNMQKGDAFYVTGATSGYNTGTAAYGQSVALGRVLSVPSATSFTYLVPTGTAASASAVGTLVRYYAVQGIVVKNIDGTVNGDSVLNFAVTTDSASNYGVIDAPLVENITGQSSIAPNGAGLITANYVNIVDAKFYNIINREYQLYPALELSVNASYMSGSMLIDGVKTLSPYKPSSSSGQSLIQLGNRDNVTINGLDATIIDAGGGWNHAVSPGTTSGGVLTINAPKITSPSGAQLFQYQASGDVGSIIVNAPNLQSNCAVGTLGGSVTGGFVAINNLNAPTVSYSLMSIYGTGITLSLTGNKLGSNTGGQGVIYTYNTSASSTLTLRSQGNDYGSVPLFANGSTFNGSGAGISAFGFDLGLDITSATLKVARTASSHCKVTTNTPNILANNLAVCDATNTTNSWKQLSNTTLTY